MDILLLLLGFIFTLLGVIGSFLPILPGPITGWIGLLLIHLTKTVPINLFFLSVTFIIAIIIFILDYIIPDIGTKRFGGTKYGIYGTTIGLLIGIILPIPFGILIGAFIGAFIGELIYNKKDPNRALKASFGAFLGFLASLTIKFSVSFVYLILFLHIFWQFKDAFLS